MPDQPHDSLRTPRELRGSDDDGQGGYIRIVRAVDERRAWADLNWTGPLADYLDLVRGDPRLACSSWQRLYDMIVSWGTDAAPEGSGRPVHHRFFDDPLDAGRDAIFGLEAPLAQLVCHLKAAAHGLGAERRVLLLHGPVGSSKSTIARLLKRGLEAVSRQPEGAIYSYRWHVDGGIHDCPMREDPLHLLPSGAREEVYADLSRRFDGEYRLAPTGKLCPVCRFYYDRLMRESGGDFGAIERAVECYRFVFSEQDRVGIGTFQPKDEKNQ